MSGSSRFDSPRAPSLSLNLARQQQARSLELRAAIGLARIWQHDGKASEARALLYSVCTWFQDPQESPDLGEARTLLGTLA